MPERERGGEWVRESERVSEKETEWKIEKERKDKKLFSYTACRRGDGVIT